MNDQHTNLNTVTEMMEHDEHESSRKMVQLVATILVGLGLLFTGYLNFQLYSRAFSADSKIFGIIPAILIEGSLATFLLGSFVWFSHGTQGKLAKFFGWAMFGIVALNTVVEFNAQLSTGTDATNINEFLKIYTFWGVPIIVPLIVGFWKAVIDADPSIQIMRMERKIQQTLQLAKQDAKLKALGADDSRQALTEYGARAAAPINAALRGQVYNRVKVMAKDDPVMVIDAEPAMTAKSSNGNGNHPN